MKQRHYVSDIGLLLYVRPIKGMQISRIARLGFYPWSFLSEEPRTGRRRRPYGPGRRSQRSATSRSSWDSERYCGPGINSGGNPPEPGPVASLSLGERARFQFVPRGAPSASPVRTQWLDGSLQIPLEVSAWVTATCVYAAWDLAAAS